MRTRIAESRNKITVSVAFDIELLEKIDKLASKMRLSRSAVIQNLVLMALDDVKLLEKLGLVDFLLSMQSFKDFLARNVKVFSS